MLKWPFVSLPTSHSELQAIQLSHCGHFSKVHFKPTSEMCVIKIFSKKATKSICQSVCSLFTVAKCSIFGWKLHLQFRLFLCCISQVQSIFNQYIYLLWIFSGSSIERLCDVASSDPTGYAQLDDRGPMVRAARTLLGSVTRVLLLADIVVVKQLLLAKDRVSYFMQS